MGDAGRVRRIYHLCDLFESAVFDFGEEEEDPECGDEGGGKPDVSSRKSELARTAIEEIWCAWSSYPYRGPQFKDSGLMKYGAVL